MVYNKDPIVEKLRLENQQLLTKIETLKQALEITYSIRTVCSSPSCQDLREKQANEILTYKKSIEILSARCTELENIVYDQHKNEKNIDFYILEDNAKLLESKFKKLQDENKLLNEKKSNFFKQRETIQTDFNNLKDNLDMKNETIEKINTKYNDVIEQVYKLESSLKNVKLELKDTFQQLNQSDLAFSETKLHLNKRLSNDFKKKSKFEIKLMHNADLESLLHSQYIIINDFKRELKNKTLQLTDSQIQIESEINKQKITSKLNSNLIKELKLDLQKKTNENFSFKKHCENLEIKLSSLQSLLKEEESHHINLTPENNNFQQQSKNNSDLSSMTSNIQPLLLLNSEIDTDIKLKSKKNSSTHNIMKEMSERLEQLLLCNQHLKEKVSYLETTIKLYRKDNI